MIVLALGVPRAGEAQRPPIPGLPAVQQSQPWEAGRDTSRFENPPPQDVGPLLDRPVSRTDYPLGPGDVLTLAILGFTNRTGSIAVTPEGTVVIPNVGVVPVSGLNLEQAEQRVARATRRVYHDAEVRISLAAVRSFKIFVVGAVDAPGVRSASATTRVSEVILPIGADGVARRNVLLLRSNGDTLRVDLVPFLQTGDLTNNPTVRDGDVVQVRRADETVTVSGELTFPGTYEFKPGETLAELLAIANGGGSFPSSAADTIWLMRAALAGRDEIQTMSRQDAIGPRGAGTILQPFDAVFVPRIAHHGERPTAVVTGEVVRPGVYPIRPNVTSVRDLVTMAGGFLPDASLADVVLRRRPIDVPRDSQRLMNNIPPEFLTREEQRIRQVISTGDDRNVVVDFTRMFAAGDSGLDTRLQYGDSLYVPQQREEVVVLGAVAQPGILQYRPGRSIEDFVEMAGGYSRRADRNDLVVIKSRAGSRLHRNDVIVIEPGDRIIVPFKEPLTVLQRIQTAEGVIGTISGLILTVVALQRLW